MCLHFADNDREVSKRLLDARCTATATSVETLHDDRLADVGFRHDQRVNVEIMVVLGVGDCRFKRLLDSTCNTLAGELQLSECALDLLAADSRSNEVELLWADAERAGDCLRLVVLQPAFGFCLAQCYFLFAFLSAP